MNKPKPGALFMQAWVSELTSVARKPSWIARKLSTRPPTLSDVQPSTERRDSSATPPAEPPPSAPAPDSEPRVPTPPLEAPRPPAVDLATSIALAQVTDENAALRAQITEMAATMAGLKREVLLASEGDLVRLALAVAERVVGRELQTEPQLVTAWAREAIETLAAKDRVVIAVAKDVRESVEDADWGIIGVEHRIQTDLQLPPGSVEVQTPEGTIAAGAEARLAAVASALGEGES